MGDFLVDFRPKAERRLDAAAAFLKFFPDIHITQLDESGFGLVLASPDNPRWWGTATSKDGKLFAALCGRVSLEQREWTEAERNEHSGGSACRLILQRYLQAGIDKVAELSGHFVVLLFDRAARKCFIVTDRWGIAPAFKFEGNGTLALGSHPDALADAVGEGRNWDLTSLAEFVLTCKVSYPFTYYQRIRTIPFASITTITWDDSGGRILSTKPYFEFRNNAQPESKLDEVAEELAAGFRKSAANRTLPLLGPAAVALSGGLDSRTLLCAVPDPERIISFCCHDVENEEFRTAQKIARAAGVRFLPLRRGPDFYADHAEQGVRISAGMGCIASNHFLGFRAELKQLGVENLLTGCYCDYLFKGLAFNKRVNRWTTKESLGSFRFSYYAGHLPSVTPLSTSVAQRLEAQFPAELRRFDTPETVAEVEHRRMFPLFYEEDSAARSIPQRTLPWYAPVAENDLMNARLRMSSAMKLNRRAFARMVQIVCGQEISQIPDANTGAPVNAPLLFEAACSHSRRVRTAFRKLRPTRATAGSWLNWNVYITSSERLRSLWERPNPAADDIFTQVLGKEFYQKEIGAYSNQRLSAFLRLFTLKLWLDQRSS